MSVPRMSFPPPRPAPPPSSGRAIVAGLLAALLGAGIWAAVVKMTEYEVGWVAWGVGALVGFAMSKFTEQRSVQLGVYAAVLAVLGLAIGKVATVRMMVPSYGREIVMENEAILAAAFAIDMRANERFSAQLSLDLARFGERDSLPPPIQNRMMDEVQARMAAAEPAERERVAAMFANNILEEVSLVEQFKASLGLFDLLWFGLAIATAFKFMRGDG
jgi:hypothetical protein